MNWSLLVFEFDMAVVAMIWIVLFRCNPARFTTLRPVERWFKRLARRKTLSIWSVGLLTVLVRVALIPVLHIPEPAVHDEFSYLLAADTFAHGKLTNPTHPMWEHFESFHIIQQPSYMSMYPPAQGLVLASGQILGHPWIGVLFSTAAMCMALCWALQGWLPPSWALFGAVLALLRVGIFSYWMNSYWGGSVPALGGALVFGALPRVMRRPNPVSATAMGLGLAILANSRPYEGLALSVPIATILIFWLAELDRTTLRVSLRRFVIPILAVLICAGLATGYYYHRVTGSAFTMAEPLNQTMYARSPLFLWQKPLPDKIYHHEVMQEFYTAFFQVYQRERTWLGFWNRTIELIFLLWAWFVGPSLSLSLITFPYARRDRRMRFPLRIGAFFLLAVLVETWLQAHYFAPALAVIFVVVLQCMRHLSHWRWRNFRFGSPMVRAIAFICCMVAVLRLIAVPTHLLGKNTWPSGNLDRSSILRQLESTPGEHLVLVRYDPRHNPGNEWVYNRADIDHSKVIWARDMGVDRNAGLLRYFNNRNVWLLNPDRSPPLLSLSSKPIAIDY